MRHAHPLLTFEKQSWIWISATSNKCFILFRLFWSEILSWRSRHSRTTRDPALKSGKFQAKIAFFLYFRRKFWHDFPAFFCFNIAKKSCFSRPLSIQSWSTPQKKPIAELLWPGSQYSRDKCWQKKLFLAWPACSVLLLARRACVLLVLRTQNPNKCSANQKKKIKYRKWPF